MLFSLIVCSVDRTEPLPRLLGSLAAQSEKDFEVILVDQNGDDRLSPILRTWSGAGLRIRPITSALGLSRARNRGIKLAQGRYLAFPDDDCWYPPDLLAAVSSRFQAHPEMAGITGRTVEPGGSGTCGRWWPREATISRRHVWRQGNSASIFLRREVVEAVGLFDETLGLGADSPWWAGEETDYLVRLLAGGYQLRYVPDLRIFHPAESRAANGHPAEVCGVRPASLTKVRRGGRGMGRVMRKHRFGIVSTAVFCARPLLGAALKSLLADRSRARYYLHSFVGRMEGLLGRCLN
jgi:glycosyltransferase involved in cell wall biosynthesis